MNWNSAPTSTSMVQADFADLSHKVGKAGASESVAIVAIIWGIVILL